MQTKLETLLPGQLEGWVIQYEDQKYNNENLYEYIDGGAELFLSYGFIDMLNRTYSKSDQPDIIVDIFNMGTSFNAYGIFSYSRENEDSIFGQGSQYVPGLLLFWKNQYYVSILFSPETEESKKNAFHIAKHIESSIISKGPLPRIISLLPDESILKNSIKYFHHYIWLNSYQFISNDNILDINDSTEAVFAKYNEGAENLILLLIKYPKHSDAESAQDSFITSFLPDLSINSVAIKDDKWIGCQIFDNLLAVVFNGKQKETVENLISRIKLK